MNEPRLSFELGFAPDADSTRPGVLVDCHNFVPGPSGMVTLPLPDSVGTIGGSEMIRGYGFAAKEFGETYANEFAGTGTKLYARDWFNGAWANASRTAGYTANAAVVWSFERFGNYVIAAARPSGIANATIPLQAIDTASGTLTAFADIAGAPTCGVLTSAERFVLAFNGQSGNVDSWACCARDNHASWTASPSTLANSGRIIDPPGEILAAAPMGNDVLVYKASGVVRGVFNVGDPEVWKWTKLPHRIGAAGPRCVAVTDDGRHVVLGVDSCYVFDGANRTDLLDSRAKRWFRRARNPSQGPANAALYDSRTGCAWFIFDHNSTVDLLPYTGTSVLALVVHLPTNRIGKVQLGADIVAMMVGTDGVPSVGWFDNASRIQWYIDTYESTIDATVIGTSIAGMTGIPAPYIVSGDIGDGWDLVDVTGARVIVTEAGSTGTLALTLHSRDTRRVAGVSDTTGIAPAGDYELFNVRANAHWHRVTITANRSVQMSGVSFDTPGKGGRRK